MLETAGGICIGSLLAVILAVVPAHATSKPFKEPGVLDEVQQGLPAIMPGDRWARMRITVDENGKPLKCGITETNVRSKETRWYMCNAFMMDWNIPPVLKDGVPVRATVERVLVMPGRAKREAEKKARKDLKNAGSKQ